MRRFSRRIPLARADRANGARWAFSPERPAFGQVRVANELKKQGHAISPFGVRSVWLRHDLETMKKRLKALEAQERPGGPRLDRGTGGGAREGQARQGGPWRVRERMPGLLRGARYVLRRHVKKGVGRVYQQTAVDTYSKVAFAKLYDRKTPLTAADLMNDRVVPFFDEHKIVVSRVLTDRGTEFCGRPESHEYELYLAIENIDHTRTKTRSPQTNGICERFHKTAARRVLSCRVPQEALSHHRRAANRSRCLARRIQ